MKNILIVAPYSTLPTDGFVNRFSRLALKFAERGYSTTFVTSRFSHRTKTFYNEVETSPFKNLKIVLIDSRSYRSHIGLRRIASLRDFRKNFEKKFPNFDDFDIVYSAYPPIGHNMAILRNVNRKRTRLVLDVQDVWPESFSAVLPWLQNFRPDFLPFSEAANNVYANFDAIVAVSRTYLNRALQGRRDAKSLVAYIGTEFDMIDTEPERCGSIKLFYIGTLSYSYDIETVIRAVHQLVSEGRKIEFNIFGDGPDLFRLRGIPHKGTTFHGLVPYQTLEARLRKQHVAVNAIRAKAPQSVTNKLCDYLGLGCPILNSQQGTEVNMLLSHVLHRSYQAGNTASAVEAIVDLIEDPSIFETWRSRSGFSREIISQNIMEFVETI